MRDIYNKHKKEVESADGSKPVKEWEFYEDMKFIDPHIIPRRYVNANGVFFKYTFQI